MTRSSTPHPWPHPWPHHRSPSSGRRRAGIRTGVILAAGVALAASGITVVTAVTGQAAAGPVVSVAGSPPALTTGRGAAVPFVEQEAEHAATNGTVLAHNFAANTLAGEASGRRAVELRSGQYVDFTLSAPANSIVVRASVPDGASGALTVSAPGMTTASLPVTSKYGWYYGSYPFNNNPGDINPHHFYDESRLLLGADLKAGTVVRVAAGAGTAAYTVDLADFEQVAPAAGQPAGSLSVTDYGADPTGAADSADAFDKAVAAGRSAGRTVWIPRGTFTINRHVIVDNVTLKGAGPWYSVLHGNGVGVYGNYAPNPSKNVNLADFAIIGEVTERNDGAQVNAIGGAMSNSTVSNIWMQHTKVGAWMDGPFDKLTISGCRILDQTADGVNFHDGVTNSTVTGTFVRNSGDDGLAMWAEHNQEIGNSFTKNTVVQPLLANAIAIYGGKDITVSDNVVADTQTQGGGLHFANRFNAVPVAGTFTVARNTALRSGNMDPNWHFGVGAIWFDGRDGAMTNTVDVTDLNLYDSPYDAIHFIGSGVTGVHFDRVNITGAGTFALQLQTTGAASFKSVVARNVGASAGIYNCQGTGAFAVTDSGGNSGWNTTFCGQWPDPVRGWDSTKPDGTTPTDSPTTSPTSPTSPTTSPTSPTGSPTTSPVTDPTVNVAKGRPATATSTQSSAYAAARAVDGDRGTYWESAAGFPASLTVDLGTTTRIGKAVVSLPAGWEERSQTLTVQGSTDGSSYATLVPAAARAFTPAGGNTVTLPFTAAEARYVRLTVTANTGWNAAQAAEFEVYPAGAGTPSPTVTPTGSPTPDPTVNRARGKAVTVSSMTDVYGGANLTDGNRSTYWESATGAFPATATVDLGTAVSGLGKVVLTLPPATAWGTRTETLAVQAGTAADGPWTTVKASAGYVFDPAAGNAVTITFPATTARYLRVAITANTGWNAGQLSEIEAYQTA